MEGTVKDDSLGLLVLALIEDGGDRPHASAPQIHPAVHLLSQPVYHLPHLFALVMPEGEDAVRVGQFGLPTGRVVGEALQLDDCNVEALPEEVGGHRVGFEAGGVVGVDVEHGRQLLVDQQQ